jgi:endonuclease/exonuclease/phosphatase family metal-dependent hydrolase
MLPVRPRQSRLRRRFLPSLGALALPFVIWFWANRLLSPNGAVQVFPDPEWPARVLERGGTVRIMAYNIAHGRGLGSSNFTRGAERRERLLAIAGLLRDSGADIVVLNEVDMDSLWSGHGNQAELLAREAGYPYRVEQRCFDLSVGLARLRFGNAVLSRFPVIAARLLELPWYSGFETTVAGHKKAVACRLDLGGGSVLEVVAVHLEHRSEEVRVRSAEALALFARSSSVPIVAAGDFNSAPLGFPRVKPDRQGRTALSLLLDEGFTTAGADRIEPDRFTFPSSAPSKQIDWILAAPPARILCLQVIQSLLSDHLPVIAEVALE